MDIEPRFLDGIYLGLLDRSDEIVVFGQEGIRKARTIRRRPDGEQWRHDELLAVRGSPLQPNPGNEDTRIKTRMEPGLSIQNTMGEPITKEDVAKEVGTQRPFYLMKADVREAASRIGYTPGCKGCRAVEFNFNSRPMHSTECRERMEPEIVSKSVRGKQRMEEFERKLAADVEERVRK